MCNVPGVKSGDRNEINSCHYCEARLTGTELYFILHPLSNGPATGWLGNQLTEL